MKKGLNITTLILGSVVTALGIAVAVVSIVSLNQSDGAIKF